MRTNKIAIFASGSGTNAENLALNFQNSDDLEVSLILTNKKEAYVIERAKKLNIPVEIFKKSQLVEGNYIINLLQQNKIDFIVLAGFLLKIPESLIAAYPEKIINIHPSLLPKYGGKGMFGQYVHQAVIAAGEKISGITIHLVNEEYDKGEILSQEKCEITPSDTADNLAHKIHQLEYKHFPRVVESYITRFGN